MSMIIFSAQTTEFGGKRENISKCKFHQSRWRASLMSQPAAPRSSIFFCFWSFQKKVFELKLRKRISVFTKKGFSLIKERLRSPRTMFWPLWKTNKLATHNMHWACQKNEIWLMIYLFNIFIKLGAEVKVVVFPCRPPIPRHSVHLSLPVFSQNFQQPPSSRS